MECPQMFTGPVGPVEVFFYWLEAILGDFYWSGAIGPLLASSPASGKMPIISRPLVTKVWLKAN